MEKAFVTSKWLYYYSIIHKIKIVKSLLFLTILCVFSISAFSQKTNTKRYSIQLNIGAASTFHHNQPVNLNLCIEGCFVEKQKPRATFDYYFALYRNFNKKNSVKIGFGTTSYKYWEKGLSNVGDGKTFVAFESTESVSYNGFSLGYRFILNPNQFAKLFLENDFIYEVFIQDYRQYQNGFAIRPTFGVTVDLTKNWGLTAQSFFKTALTPYDDLDWGRDYMPYAYGVQLGINLKI